MIMKNKKTEGSDVLQDLRYMCESSPIITEALKNGNDVVQMPNGDIIVTQVKVINTQYKWNSESNCLILEENVGSL
jgi:hypothetical protein